MSLQLNVRIKVEKLIVTTLVQDILANGFTVSINNGGDSWEIHRSTDLSKIIATLFATDEETIYFFKKTETSGYSGWFRLVYGNDGYDVISNYTDNAPSRDIVAGAEKLADAIVDGKFEIKVNT